MPGNAYRTARIVLGLCPGCAGPRGDGWQCAACERKAAEQHRKWRIRRRLARSLAAAITLTVTL